MDSRMMYKRLYFSGTGAYIFMFVLAVLFYKERIVFLDTAFTLFHIIKDHSFCIQVYRFGDVFSQLLPVLSVKAGLPLDNVVMSYSIGFIAYFFTCYLLCGSLLKQYEFALVVLLLNILFVSETFYWTTSQLPESLALLMVVLAFVNRRMQNELKPAHISILCAGLVTVAFFHPISAIILLYSIIFFRQRGDLIVNQKLLYIVVGVFVAAIAAKSIFFRTLYERGSLSGMKNFITRFPDYFTLYSNKRFLATCISKYYWIPVLFAGTVLVYTRERKWKQLLSFLLFFPGYLLLVNVCYPTEITPLFYIESMYLPLGIILALPFVFDVLPLLDKRKLALPALVVIVLTGCARLYAAHDTYAARHAVERRYLDYYGDRKVVARAKKADADTLQLLWGTAYECLFLSEIERHKSASIVIEEDPMKMEWPLGERKSLLVNWDKFSYASIDGRYFQFTDTVTTYTRDLSMK